ncbi:MULTISPECIES: SDR family oxidoreductase [Luteimonas]|uniref:SDR family oxidoreductase n=1 Tax=Luteimonas TaxID=83614 RepID=UPI000C7B29B8|nr:MULTISPECIES: SDR family oxidoreductase [Luteimonas]
MSSNTPRADTSADAALRDARQQAERAADAQRRIQSDATERARQRADAAEDDAPVQAGAREQPENPMPAQHLDKPGNEHALDLAPRFLAPDYRGSGKLDGMRAVVTGGDSGIGRAVAVLFAREGADVAIVYLDEHEDAATTVSHIEEEGRRGLAISGDVKDPAFCRQAVQATVDAFGGLDILVNNAAFQQHVDHIEDLADAQILETLHTNIAGYMYMARAALPHMRQGASIINSGSETGLFGSSALLDYSATKGAIHAFTKALASQLLPRGIRVNAVAPGPVWTPLNPADRSADEITGFGKKSDIGRPAQPEEVSPAYVFLASPVTASYVNGVVLPVMGGPTG